MKKQKNLAELILFPSPAAGKYGALTSNRAGSDLSREQVHLTKKFLPRER
jgi:hypothetical protein